MYNSYSRSCEEYGVPYGVYVYSLYTSVAQAEKEAKVFYNAATANGRKPVFFVIDIEEKYITKTATDAYIKKLRSLAAADGNPRVKIGLYVAHHLYSSLKLNVKTDKTSASPDFIWIPRYGTNATSSITHSPNRPAYPCDMWQYSSSGMIQGISGKVDMNTIYDRDNKNLLSVTTGTSRSYFNLNWLITR